MVQNNLFCLEIYVEYVTLENLESPNEIAVAVQFHEFSPIVVKGGRKQKEKAFKNTRLEADTQKPKFRFKRGKSAAFEMHAADLRAVLRRHSLVVMVLGKLTGKQAVLYGSVGLDLSSFALGTGKVTKVPRQPGAQTNLSGLGASLSWGKFQGYADLVSPLGGTAGRISMAVSLSEVSRNLRPLFLAKSPEAPIPGPIQQEKVAEKEQRRLQREAVEEAERKKRMDAEAEAAAKLKSSFSDDSWDSGEEPPGGNFKAAEESNQDELIEDRTPTKIIYSLEKEVEDPFPEEVEVEELFEVVDALVATSPEISPRKKRPEQPLIEMSSELQTVVPKRKQKSGMAPGIAGQWSSKNFETSIPFNSTSRRFPETESINNEPLRKSRWNCTKKTKSELQSTFKRLSESKPDADELSAEKADYFNGIGKWCSAQKKTQAYKNAKREIEAEETGYVDPPSRDEGLKSSTFSLLHNEKEEVKDDVSCDDTYSMEGDHELPSTIRSIEKTEEHIEAFHEEGNKNSDDEGSLDVMLKRTEDLTQKIAEQPQELIPIDEIIKQAEKLKMKATVGDFLTQKLQLPSDENQHIQESSQENANNPWDGQEHYGRAEGEREVAPPPPLFYYPGKPEKKKKPSFKPMQEEEDAVLFASRSIKQILDPSRRPPKPKVAEKEFEKTPFDLTGRELTHIKTQSMKQWTHKQREDVLENVLRKSRTKIKEMRALEQQNGARNSQNQDCLIGNLTEEDLATMLEEAATGAGNSTLAKMFVELNGITPEMFNPSSKTHGSKTKREMQRDSRSNQRQDSTPNNVQGAEEALVSLVSALVNSGALSQQNDPRTANLLNALEMMSSSLN